MNHPVITLLVAFITFTSVQTKAQVKNTAIQGYAGSNMSYITISRTAVHGISTKTDTVRLGADKMFRYSLKLWQPEMIYLSYGDKKPKSIQLWINPGNRLSVDFRGVEPKFEGKDAPYAAYYPADKEFWTTIYAEFSKRNPQFDDNSNRFSDKYFIIQDSITLQRTNFLNNYFAANPDPNKRAFIKMQSASFLYSSLYYKLTFDGSDVEKFKFYQDRYHVYKSGAYQFSDKAVFNNAQLLDIAYYCEFMRQFVMDLTQKMIRATKQKWTIDAYIDTAMHVIDELTGQSSITISLKAVFLNDLTEEVKREHRLNYVDKIHSTVSQLYNSPATSPQSLSNNYKDKATTNIKKINTKPDAGLQLVKEKLYRILIDTRFNKGAPAPDFIFKDTTGRQYTLADFKGKKVYIDMGASWCGPCIAGIPAWNKLAEENADNHDVIFISLSLDDTESDWKKLLHSRTIKGILLFAGGGFKGSFATAYSISAIPHYLLLDTDGKILEYSAPAAGDKAIKSLLSGN